MHASEKYEQLVIDLYAARTRRDFDRVRGLLADDIAWHEPGDEDFSGTHRGREVVVSLLEGLVETTQGTFRLELTGTLSTTSHVAATVRWSAVRAGVEASGHELAVYRIATGRIAEAWFFLDGYDPQALSTVFSPEGSS